MSCGVCPGDRIATGLALATRLNGYGASTPGYGCGSTRSIPIYNINSQTQTNYGRNTMQRSTYNSARHYRPATNYVPNLYAKALYTPVLKVEFEEKLENRLTNAPSQGTLESLILPESKSFVNLKGAEDVLIERAQVIDLKRRRIANEIQSLRKSEYEKEAA